jgi:hypothetical protein
MIEPVVDAAIRGRPRYPYEWAGGWQASVCGANRYDGASSNVGWHADQLTCEYPYILHIIVIIIGLHLTT